MEVLGEGKIQGRVMIGSRRKQSPQSGHTLSDSLYSSPESGVNVCNIQLLIQVQLNSIIWASSSSSFQKSPFSPSTRLFFCWFARFWKSLFLSLSLVMALLAEVFFSA